jgi:GNAT superfamily N-acetyltransferase
MTGEAAFLPPPLVLLSQGHDASQFDSGEPALDSWLREHAARTARRHLSATHVWAQEEGRILAYATLAAGVLLKADLPKAVGHGYPDRIPAILLGRLALDKQLRGQGLGGVLLAEVLGIAAQSAGRIAAAFVVVDALNESAASFYLHHGFTQLPGTNRLIVKVASVIAVQHPEEPGMS